MNTSTVTTVHTLGPPGTNCESAARHWLLRQQGDGSEVVLHDSLEEAVDAMLAEPRESALVGCIVYPRLHEIVFQHLDDMVLSECFVLPTHSMVLAAPSATSVVRTVASHSAPVNLLDGLDVTIVPSASNSGAALTCARGETDACITTDVAARANQLAVLHDFGPVAMGFSVHVARRDREPRQGLT
ncbi:prephenate dehydratase domain-containing protein [Streptomyces huasconensis]|uniref:prephenate dehydratase domain-containing protein n=1 Tax=Streptomyces huasconensis TaxID=1854574 RepID=UPI0036F4DD23